MLPSWVNNNQQFIENEEPGLGIAVFKDDKLFISPKYSGILFNPDQYNDAVAKLRNLSISDFPGIGDGLYTAYVVETECSHTFRLTSERIIFRIRTERTMEIL